jgi:general transcription factor 3C polypeptide 3 (transcription factor C subunit 4)
LNNKAVFKRNRVLPQEIQGLMGEANLAFARSEKNKAIDICLEVIKNAPNASEPYQLLSLLYSEIGDTEKALKVGLISAQLNKDQDEWIQLIQQALIEGNEELILFCYNNAIQCNPFNIEIHLARIKFIEEKQDVKNLILAKIMLLKYLDVNLQYELYEKIFTETLSVSFCLSFLTLTD